jgi:hypothetical protein
LVMSQKLTLELRVTFASIANAVQYLQEALK